ncbi:hypothetical protein Lfu02_03720 [Longispora fulva]|uniref:Cytochrome P450 n=1 Tax=Longispora fulva TaxID=619741 RepID=A0A8J7GC09_9ACTN|nr:cytochrome P450 [Longispora fulva]MBG6135759.1 cytochrome P450 [Longispora fulva]GIG56000.1 hypothetical protein Lfu02_03720 [Longispora fulva]
MRAPDRPAARLDFTDPGFQTNPWPLYDWHRRHEPVTYSEAMNCYFVFGYRHVRHVLTSQDFTAHHPFRRSRVAFGPSALDSEGVVHARLRGSLTEPFRPRTVLGYQQVISDIVRSLVDELLPSGRPDWLDELAWRLPTRVACRILGLPEDDDRLLYQMMRPLILFVDHATVGYADVVGCRDRLRAYLRDTIDLGLDREAMLRGMVESRTLTDGEIVDNAILLLAAATETTCSAVINLLARVAGTPGLWASLRANPSRVPAVVAETLRHEPPLHVTLRYAAADVELAGCAIPAGAPVQVCLASANRDPDVFADPDTWDSGRERHVPMTFGVGRHHCLGSALAQAELETLVHELLGRLADLWTTAPTDLAPRGRTFRSVQGLRLGHRP